MANITGELNPTTENGDSARIKINNLIATMNVLFKKDASGNITLNEFPKSRDMLPREDQIKLETFTVSQDKTKLEISKEMELDYKQIVPGTQDLIEASQVLATMATVSELIEKASVTPTAAQIRSLLVRMQELDDSGVMFARGIVTDVNAIKTTGIYEGINVANAPVQGAVIIEAYKDTAGDIDLTLKDSTMRRYEGGKRAGSDAVWHTVQATHLYGNAVPADTLGQDGDLYFKTV